MHFSSSDFDSWCRCQKNRLCDAFQFKIQSPAWKLNLWKYGHLSIANECVLIVPYNSVITEMNVTINSHRIAGMTFPVVMHRACRRELEFELEAEGLDDGTGCHSGVFHNVQDKKLSVEYIVSYFCCWKGWKSESRAEMHTRRTYVAVEEEVAAQSWVLGNFNLVLCCISQLNYTWVQRGDSKKLVWLASCPLQLGLEECVCVEVQIFMTDWFWVWEF